MGTWKKPLPPSPCPAKKQTSPTWKSALSPCQSKFKGLQVYLPPAIKGGGDGPCRARPLFLSPGLPSRAWKCSGVGEGGCGLPLEEIENKNHRLLEVGSHPDHILFGSAALIQSCQYHLTKEVSMLAYKRHDVCTREGAQPEIPLLVSAGQWAQTARAYASSASGIYGA